MILRPAGMISHYILSINVIPLLVTETVGLSAIMGPKPLLPLLSDHRMLVRNIIWPSVDPNPPGISPPLSMVFGLEPSPGHSPQRSESILHPLCATAASWSCPKFTSQTQEFLRLPAE